MFIHSVMHFFWKYKLDHIIFWSITIAFYAFVTTNILKEANIYQYGLNILIRNGLLMLICYTNIYYLFPSFFRKNKYVLYVVFILVCLLLYTILKNAHDAWLYGYFLNDVRKQNFFYNTYYNFSIAFFYLCFTMALSLSKKWYKQHLLLQKIQVENLKTELRYLKAQLNPHFVFNSINTTYFQIDKSNTAARESLQKFSELLRYQLYECNEEQIAIEKEIDYLKSYIDLQRLRKQKNYNIQFETCENISRFSIAPLLLISFVENAFKHVSNYTDRANDIYIGLRRQNDYLLFDVVNSKNGNNTQVKDGIGLTNAKRRLELLYADKHDLQISNELFLYTVHLKLKIL